MIDEIGAKIFSIIFLYNVKKKGLSIQLLLLWFNTIYKP